MKHITLLGAIASLLWLMALPAYANFVPPPDPPPESTTGAGGH